MSDRSGQARALTIFTPIRPGEERPLHEYLTGLPRGSGSPLAASDRTHVARWLIVDRLPDYCVPHQDRLRRQHLLFSSSFDGEERSYLEGLTTILQDRIPAIWGRCEDFPGLQSRSGFVAWLLEHRVATSFFFAAYGHETLHDVRNALAAREQALAFALRAQALDPPARLQAFREAFPWIRPFAEPKLDLADVQGNILKGYNFPFVAYVWVRVGDARAGRVLLGRLLPRVTTATPWNGGKPRSTLNVGITFAGLQALDVPSWQLEAFPPDFREGMAARAATLGDTGEDDPSHWDAGLGTGDAHILVTINAVASEALDEALAELRRQLDDASLSVVNEAQCAALGGNREHFGFSDGFSQPGIEGDGNVSLPGHGIPEPDGRWSELALGEFLMGYEDEDGEVFPAPTGPLGCNATYMVYRKLYQDVAAFRRALSERAAGFPGGEERLAAKIVGRWRDGTPVELSPDTPDASLQPAQLNDFRYEDDGDGRRCPLGAHIRRVNPRDALGWHGKRTRRHRMIRRGMPYGPPLPDGAMEDDGQDRGLFFVSFCGSLRRQFEIVQAAWAADGNLFGLGDDRDWMLLADDRPTAKMTIQGDPPHFVAGQPRFVTVRGGEYVFVPSIAGLRSLSA